MYNSHLQQTMRQIAPQHTLRQLLDEYAAEQKMESQMDCGLGQQLQQQYYKTMEFVYRTGNYAQPIVVAIARANRSRTEMRDEYCYGDGSVCLPEASLVGNIHRLEDFRLRLANQEVETMRVAFRCTYDGKDKLILVQKADYRSSFAKHFNRMIKNKGERYILTHLHPVLVVPGRLGGPSQLYFLLQPYSQVIQVSEQFYTTRLRPLERILDQGFSFSRMSLDKIFGADELDNSCKEGFVLAQVRQKFEAREKESISLVGLVTSIEPPLYDKVGNSRKEMVIWMTQTLYPFSSPNEDMDDSWVCSQEMGRCRVILRYSPADENYVEGLLQLNHEYLLSDLQVMITESVSVLYVLSIAKNNAKNCCILKLSQEPKEGINFGGDLMRKTTMPFIMDDIERAFQFNLITSCVGRLRESNINGNIVKLKVGLLQVEIIYGSIRCSLCGYEIKRNDELDRVAKQTNHRFYQMEEESEEDRQLHCRNRHQEKHCLQLWGTVRVADETGPCLISMEHKELIRFLDLEPYYEQIEKVVVENRKGMVIMASNKDKLRPEEDPLFPMKNRVRRTYLEKTVVGFAKAELDKTFRQGLNEDDQLGYQESLQNVKKYLQNKKIFPNGLIENRGEETVMLPFIKAVQVLETGW